MPRSVPSPTRSVDPVAPVALVTGASGEIGGAIARHLSERGFAVGLHGNRSRAALEALASALPGPSTIVLADVADAAAVEKAAAKVTEALGPVGVLVTAAGIRVDGLAHAQDAETWARTVQVNLLGTYHACRAVLPAMLKARGGRIVLISSPTGAQGRSGQTAYGASKAGVDGLVRSLAREVGRRGVTVNALSPGFVDSEMTRMLPEQIVDDLRGRVDLGRFGTPADLLPSLDMVLDSPYLTGQVIGIDGGLHL